jgi:endo-1,4-beta-xylanase
VRSSRKLTLALAGLIVALVAGAIVVKAVEQRGPDAVPLPGPPLRIGTAVDDLALQHEPGYREVLRTQFRSLTPENVMKWSLMHPERDRYDWKGGDRLVDFGLPVRGHTLVWWNQLPDWVQQTPAKELRQVVREHVRAVTGHFRGKVGVWDVVNEPLDEQGRLRDDLFARRIGPDWVADAFRTAKVGDPGAKLYLNETAADGIGPKSDGLYRLVRGLLADGVPIDGVGLQAHFTLGDPPSGFRENLERFEALGIEVAVTELDVALELPADAAKLRKQAEVYAEVGRTCRAVGCASLAVWGFTDRHSWIPATQPGRGAATLLDDELRPKPAFAALQRALHGGG